MIVALYIAISKTLRRPPCPVPYLYTIHRLNAIDDNFDQDDARSIVLYFLSNAARWRGETAKRIRAELKELLKHHGGAETSPTIH